MVEIKFWKKSLLLIMYSRKCRRQYVLKCISFISMSPLSCCFKTATVGEFIRPGNRDQCFFRESSTEAAAKVTRSCISCIIIAWPQNCSLLYWWWLWESDSLQCSKMLRISRELHFRINLQILVEFRCLIQKKRKLVLVILLVIPELVIKSLFLFPLCTHLLVSLSHSLTLS